MAEDNSDTPSNFQQTDRMSLSLDVAAAITSAIPWAGGPVSSVLSGLSVGRKMSRVQSVLDGVAEDLRDFRQEASEQYVRTEEFEDLLEATLRRVAAERHENKRQVYRAFLTDMIASPGRPYDEQLRFLRTLEELQPDHLRVLKAIGQLPEGGDGLMGSPSSTLSKRLPDVPHGQIATLVAQLNDMRLINLQSYHTMMTFSGAQDLRHSITAYGARFLAFLKN